MNQQPNNRALKALNETETKTETDTDTREEIIMRLQIEIRITTQTAEAISKAINSPNRIPTKGEVIGWIRAAVDEKLYEIESVYGYVKPN